MNKVILFLAVFAFIGVTGCKKSYTCTCVNDTTQAISSVSVNASSIVNATAQCDAQTEGGTATCNY